MPRPATKYKTSVRKRSRKSKKNEPERFDVALLERRIRILKEDLSYLDCPTSKEPMTFMESHGIKISVIVIDCKMGATINIQRFAKRVKLSEIGIISVKSGDRYRTAATRSLVPIKTKKKPSKKGFYNQIAVIMKPPDSPGYVNIKIFINGSLHMTGCKSMDDFEYCKNKLVQILEKGVKTINRHGELVHLAYVDEEKLNVTDVNISLINSNFKVDFEIDRQKLYLILRENHSKGSDNTEFGHVVCEFNSPPASHPGVKISHYYRGDDGTKHCCSIFVFKTGSVVITGANQLIQIIMAYQYICRILYRYKKDIIIYRITDVIVQRAMQKYEAGYGTQAVQSRSQKVIDMFFSDEMGDSEELPTLTIDIPSEKKKRKSKTNPLPLS